MDPAKAETEYEVKHSSLDNEEITKVMEKSVKEGPAATLHTPLDLTVVKCSEDVGVVRATLSGVTTGLNKGSCVCDPTEATTKNLNALATTDVGTGWLS